MDDLLNLPSPGKLNLFLYINGRRNDGYHELQTLFQFIDYGDEIQLQRTDEAEIVLLEQLADVPQATNLAYRAAKLLQNHTACTQGARIKIKKRLPIGGGLGGGSSNAATVLVGLNQLWKTDLSLTELAQLGLSLGADVPIFVQGHSAIAEGIGDQFCYCQPTEKWYLVLKPNIAISTAVVFNHPALTRDTPKRTNDSLLMAEWSNDCEKIVRCCYPEVDEVIQWLLKYAPSRLTGTGACVFAEFDNEAEARKVFLNKPKNTTGFVAKGQNRSPLHQKLFYFQSN